MPSASVKDDPLAMVDTFITSDFASMRLARCASRSPRLEGRQCGLLRKRAAVEIDAGRLGVVHYQPDHVAAVVDGPSNAPIPPTSLTPQSRP